MTKKSDSLAAKQESRKKLQDFTNKDQSITEN